VETFQRKIKSFNPLPDEAETEFSANFKDFFMSLFMEACITLLVLAFILCI